jgi:hypothetical protein
MDRIVASFGYASNRPASRDASPNAANQNPRYEI